MSDVDRDYSSQHKPSLKGMHRGSSLVEDYRLKGTIVSNKSGAQNSKEISNVDLDPVAEEGHVREKW